MKRITNAIMRRIYGVRGGIKPPIKGTRFFRLRSWWNGVANWLYDWCGIPDEWEAWYLGPEKYADWKASK